MMSLVRIWKRHTVQFMLGILALMLLVIVIVSSNGNSSSTSIEPTGVLNNNDRTTQRSLSLNHSENRPKITNTSAAAPDTKLYPERLNVSERFVKRFTLRGDVYDENGVFKRILFPASTSLLHSFSPQTENHFRGMILDPVKEHPVYANSPAMAWHEGKLRVVLRMWLHKEMWEEKKLTPRNTFSDNFLYRQSFDANMEPLEKGSLMGMPVPNQWLVGDGPIEPRLFKHTGKLYMSFNAGIVNQVSKSHDGTFFWSFEEMRLITPTFRGGSPMERAGQKGDRMVRDKHWIPFEDRDGEIYFIYTFDPLRIIKINMALGEASVVFTQVTGQPQFTDVRNSIRGGTPHVEYTYPYFISIAHCTLFDKDYKRVYTTNLVVLKVAKPDYKIVYRSDPIEYRNDLLAGIPIVRSKYISRPFVFPVSLILEDEDTLVFGAHINDFSSVIFRFRGLKVLMKDVMRIDSKLGNTGPPIGTLNNRTRITAAQAVGAQLLG